MQAFAVVLVAKVARQGPAIVDQAVDKCVENCFMRMIIQRNKLASNLAEISVVL